jgi:undecaprenyl phosphate-alpha-L-ara4N flippase subunit ArnF
VSGGRERAIGIACLAASIGLSAAGQLGMKVGMDELRAAGGVPGAAAAWLDPALRPALAWTAAGLAAYGASLLTWLAVLARFSLSRAYPVLAVSYVLVYFAATHWDRLHEAASPARTAGTLAILIGVALVSFGRERGS